MGSATARTVAASTRSRAFAKVDDPLADFSKTPHSRVELDRVEFELQSTRITASLRCGAAIGPAISTPAIC
jgi:hypothetical protein